MGVLGGRIEGRVWEPGTCLHTAVISRMMYKE